MRGNQKMEPDLPGANRDQVNPRGEQGAAVAMLEATAAKLGKRADQKSSVAHNLEEGIYIIRD